MIQPRVAATWADKALQVAANATATWNALPEWLKVVFLGLGFIFLGLGFIALPVVVLDLFLKRRATAKPRISASPRLLVVANSTADPDASALAAAARADFTVTTVDAIRGVAPALPVGMTVSRTSPPAAVVVLSSVDSANYPEVFAAIQQWEASGSVLVRSWGGAQAAALNPAPELAALGENAPDVFVQNLIREFMRFQFRAAQAAPARVQPWVPGAMAAAMIGLVVIPTALLLAPEEGPPATLLPSSFAYVTEANLYGRCMNSGAQIPDATRVGVVVKCREQYVTMQVHGIPGGENMRAQYYEPADDKKRLVSAVAVGELGYDLDFDKSIAGCAVRESLVVLWTGQRGQTDVIQAWTVTGERVGEYDRVRHTLLLPDGGRCSFESRGGADSFAHLICAAPDHQYASKEAGPLCVSAPTQTSVFKKEWFRKALVNAASVLPSMAAD